MLTWSSIGNKRNYEKLSGYTGHGDDLLYGLIKNDDDRIIKMDDNEAIILNLGIMLDPSVVKEHQLEDLNIWYFESDIGFNGREIKLINKDTEEEINTILVESTN